MEGIDTDILPGSRKNKEIVKLFLNGMTYKEIAGIYGLTTGRIGQILDRQARRANLYKKLSKDHDYQGLVREYMEKLKRGKSIIISSKEKDNIFHIMAKHEARMRINFFGERIE